MKVHSILTKTRAGSKIALVDYLSGEVYINDIDVANIIDNKAYYENYRQREVYAIEIDNGVMNLEVI